MLATRFASPERQQKQDLESIRQRIEQIPYISAVFDALPHVALILNADRQVVYANNALLEMLRISDCFDVLGERPGEIFNCIHAGNGPSGCGTGECCQVCGVCLAILKCQEKKEKIDQEARLTLQQNGQLISHEFHIAAAPFFLDDQQFSIVSLIDISHEKRRQILERTFFHDIINTAGSISSMVQIISEMMQESDNKPIMKYMTLLTRASEHLVEEIKTQKELLAAENEELIVSPQKMRSLAFLSHIMKLAREHRSARRRYIRIDRQSVDVEFTSDRTLLSRIILNMLINAMEASAPEETVTIGCRKSGGLIEFSVHNPLYIERDLQLQIFQRSFSTKGSQRGLGTYIMKLLAEKYLQGDVSFDSVMEKGTTFRIRLPIPTDCDG